MEHYVITIGRELGSGGKAIGELMAKELSIPVYDRRLILMAAEENGFDPAIFKQADETPSKGLMSQVIHSLSSPFAAFSSLYSNSMSNESLFKLQSDIILQKAQNEDCIIVGRCSDYILRHHPRHVSIFVRGNYDDRLRFIMQRNHLTQAEAKELIEHTDAIRSDYHNFYSETNWGDSRAYDICINSSLLGLEGTARMLTEFVKAALEIKVKSEE
jgi:cytidylate kinase